MTPSKRPISARTALSTVTDRARSGVMTQTVRKAALWRLPLLVAAVVLLLAGCGPAEPGKDALGNSAAKATTGGVPAGYHRDCKLGQALDKCPVVKDGPAITTTAITATVETVDPDAPAAVVTLKVGETADVTLNDGDAAGTIQVQKAAAYRKTKAGALGSRPKNGRYVQVTISARSTSGVFSLNPLYFQVTNADGDVFGAGEGNSLFEDGDRGLHATDLNPGQRVRGTVTFDVPPAAKTLEYAPFGQTLATWSLP